MNSCEYCKMVESGKTKIYEDDLAVAFLPKSPASFGHIILVSRAHYPIFEQVPDNVLAQVGLVSNKLSIAVFDALKVAGTNIIIENGLPAGQLHPHFAMHIIPRSENDGLAFSWKTKQLTEEEMSTVELVIKDQLSKTSPTEPQKLPEEDVKPEQIAPKPGKVNFLIKQLNRIP